MEILRKAGWTAGLLSCSLLLTACGPKAVADSILDSMRQSKMETEFEEGQEADSRSGLTADDVEENEQDTEKGDRQLSSWGVAADEEEEDDISGEFIEEKLTQKDIDSDTVQWFNTTYALLTKANGGDIKLIGGLPRIQVSQELERAVLERDWSITDAQSARETIEYLLLYGHREEYQTMIESMDEAGMLVISRSLFQSAVEQEVDKEEAAALLAVYDACQAYGMDGITAWDLCRAIQLHGDFYLAGYMSLTEAMDGSLEIAKQLQSIYGSWDEMVESYLWGYQFWQWDDMSDPNSASAERKAIYDNLKKSKENPYTLDWDLELKDTWSDAL